MLKKIIINTLLTLISIPVFAGTACKNTPLTINQLIAASQQSMTVQKVLNQQSPEVALIARVGTDLRKYHLHYSHLAFVVKNYPGKPGKWTVIHLLNKCGTSQSSLYAQGLMNFFMDNLYSLDYKIIVPAASVQKRLYTILVTNKKKAFHNKQYTMLAYPFSTRYQNSNQWVLEVFTAAINPKISSRTSAQNYLLKTHYQPTIITIGALTKLGASVVGHIKFDDHPRTEIKRNQYSTITVDSVVNYLQKEHLLIN